MPRKTETAKWETIEFVMIATIGTLLHFVYEWSGRNPLVAFFAPVNESVWEHLKLLFMPAFFVTLLQEAFIGKKYPSLLWEKGKAVLSGMLFIVVFFYTYSGVLGRHIAWVDIVSFYLAVAWYCISAYKNLQKKPKSKNNGKGIVIFILFFLAFVIFTLQTPAFGIFTEP